MEQELFNLWEENWIKVRTPENEVTEVSLEEVLLHAENYIALAGELPTQDFAILRLLLAILHTALFREPPEDPDDEWETLWKRGSFPQEKILDYEKMWKERFNLFDPEKPFYQVLDMEGKNKMSVVRFIGAIDESDNKKRHFLMRSGEEKTSLSFSESARWLIHFQAYDHCAMKYPSPKLAPLGQIGGIFAIGKNLFETLALNLVLKCDGSKDWDENNVPVWEKNIEPVPSTNKDIHLLQIPLHQNPASLYTVQSRYVKLIPRNGKVTGFYARAGNWYEIKDGFTEQMTLWKKDNENYCPLKFDQPKQMWREFSSLDVQKKAGDKEHLCGLIRWIADCEGYLGAKFLIKFQIVGVKYDDKNSSFIEKICSDSLNLHLGLLSKIGMAWMKTITEEINQCEEISNDIMNLSRDLSKAVGITEQSNKDNKEKIENNAVIAKERYFSKLDLRFRQWLVSLDPEKYEEQVDEKRQEWEKYSLRTAFQLGQELVDEAGPAAFRGRNVSENNKEHYYSASKAFNKFQNKLNSRKEKNG